MPPKNKPPVFTTLQLSVDENSPAGTVIALGSDYSKDSNKQTLSYEIVGGADASFFEIDANTGELRLSATAPDLDFEGIDGVTGPFEVEIRITDDSGDPLTQSATEIIQILVNDTDEVPPEPTPAPTLELDQRDDSGSLDTDGITSDVDLRLSGTAESRATVKIFQDGVLIGEVQARNNGNWNFNAEGLGDGDYEFEATAIGTSGIESTPSTTFNLTIDTTAPVLESFTSTTSDGDYGPGSLITITANYSEDVVAGSTLTVTLDNGESVVLDVVSGSTISGTYTVGGLGSGQDSFDLTVTSIDSESVEDIAGNTQSSSTIAGLVSNLGDTSDIVIDTTAPGVVSISLDNDSGSSNVDALTNDGSYTVSGAEVGATIEYSVDDTNWSSTPVVAVEGSNTIYTRQIDLAGNAGPSASLSFTLDTNPPALLSITLDNDTGSSGVDGITSDGAYTVSGEEGGATIEYSTDDANWGTTAIVPSEGANTIYVRQVDVAGNAGPSALLSFTLDTTAPGTLTIALDNDTGSSGVDGITNNGSYTVSGEEGGATIEYSTDNATWGTTAIVPSEGANTIYVRQIDIAGNTGPSALLSFTLDTSAPAAPTGLDLDPASDTGTSNTDDITDDTTPTINGSAEIGSTVSLFDTDGVTLLGTAIADGGGNWSITSSVLSEGDHTLTATATDAAGNESSASSGLTITIDTSGGGDTQAPELQSFTSTTTDDTYGPGASIDITANYDESIAAGSTLTVVLDNGESVLLDTIGGSSISGTYTVGATGSGEDSSDLTVASISAESVSDAAANEQTSSSVPASNIADTSDIVIDTTAPAALSISLDDDTGSSGVDGITSDGSYTVSGEELTATFEYSTDDATWGGTPIVPTEGGNTIYVRQVDAAGNVGPSALLSFTLDTTNPAALSIALDNDTGTSSVDGITSDGSYTVSGEEGGATIQYSTDDATWGTTAIVPTEGANDIYVRQVDVAGNAGPSALLSFTLDTTNPAALSIALDNDTGTSSVDGITNDGSYTVSGEEGGATIEYSTDDTTWGTTAIVASEGGNAIYVRQIDVAGNAGPSALLSFTLDTSAPAAPTGLDLDPASDTGSSNSDDITGDTTPTINGSAEIGSTVTLFDTNGITVLGTDTADGSGNWSITSSLLTEGDHTLTATATDTAGNESPASSGLTITIDTSGGGDTQAPELQSFTSTTIDDTYGPGASINITANYDEPIAAGSSLTVVLDNGESVLLDTIGGSSISGTYTVGATGSGQDSSDLTVASISAESVSDAAANEQTSSSVPASNIADTSDIVIDTTAPATLSISLDNDTGTSGVDGITNDGSYTVSGEELTATIEYSTDDATWGGTPIVPTEGGNTIYVRQVDAAGNAGPSTSLSFTLDTTAPAVPTGLDLDTASDTGSSDTDDITADNTPTINGLADAGSTVTLYDTDGSTALGTDTADGGGNWSITASSLGDGNHILTARASDTAGNESSPSTSLAIRVDTTAPTTTITIDSITTDTGTSNSDFITRDNDGLTIGATLSTSLDTDERLEYSNDNGSSWTDITESVTGTAIGHTDTALTSSTTVQMRVIDTAGNTGAAASQLITIDNTAPTTTITIDSITTDSGNSGSDFITNDNDGLTINATLSTGLAGDEILEYSNDNGATWAEISGSVSGTAVTHIDGALTSTTTIQMRVVDTAGNPGPADSQLITIDTAAPAAPTGLDLDATSDTGSSDTDDITADNTPTINGSAEAGSSVTLYDTDGSTVLGTDTADGSGNWSITASSLSDGNHILTARATDIAGNESSPSASLAIRVDTTAPTTTISIDSITDDTGTSSSDFITNDNGGLTIDATLSATLDTDERLEYSSDNGSSWTDITESVSGTAISHADASLTSSTTIQMRVIDDAGNTGTVASQSITIDTTAPTTNVSIDSINDDTGNSSSDFITNDNDGLTINATLTAGLTGDEILEYSNDNGATWTDISGSVSGTAVTHIDAALTSTTTIQMRVADIAGNTGEPTPQLITIDTTAPGTLTIALDNDTGSSGADNITSDGNYTVSGEEAGATIEYSTDDATWGTTAIVASEGGNTIYVRQIDVAGNAGPSALLSFTLDTSAPAAPTGLDLDPASDTGTSNSDDITDDTTPTINGSAEAGSNISLFDTDGVTLLGTAVADGGGNWSITSSLLTEGDHTLTATATDAAGNESSASSGLTITIDTSGGGDTQAPELQSFSSTTSDDTYGPGASINITANYDESIAAGSTLTVVLDNGESVLLDTIGGSSISGTYTVGATGSGEDSSDLTVASISAESVSDAAANTQTSSAVPASNIADTSDIVIDTTAPTTTITIDSITDDTGVSASDFITNDADGLFVAGTLSDTLEAGERLEYSNDNGGSWADISGSVTGNAVDFDDTALTTTNTIQLRVVDAAENIGPTASQLVTIDTTPPAALSISLDNDTGTSGVDGITSDGSYTVSGEEGSATIEYSTDDATWGTTAIVPSEGGNTIYVRQVDVAGNAGPSTLLSLTLDTTNPAALSIALDDDTGSSGVDGITNDGNYTVSGEEGGATIEYSTDDANWGTTAIVPSEGANTIYVRQIDIAGNTGPSALLSFTLDTSAPAAPTGLDLDPASDTGTSDSDDITGDTTPTINGSAVAGSIVSLFDTDGVTLLGTDTADGGGNWSITTTALSDGDHTLTATATDVAGNESSASTGLTITIDTAGSGDVQAPQLQSFTSTTLDDTYGPGASIQIIATYDEAVTAGSELTVNLDTGESVTLNSIAGTAISGTYTVGATGSGQNTSDLTVASISSQSVADGAGNTQTGTSLPLSNIADTSDIVVDTTAPAALSISLDDDTGISSVDGITSDGSYTVTGEELTATIEYSTDDATWGTTAIVPSEGANTIYVRQVDVAGNAGPSALLSFTLDTANPAALSISLDDDTGTSGVDDITNDGSYTVSGEEGGATIQYSTDDATWGTTAIVPTEGANTIYVRQIDVAGNVGPSTLLSFTLDTSNPAALSISLDNDTGTSGVDGITSDGSYTVTGEEGGATIEYSTDDSTWGTTAIVPSEGANTIYVRQVDVAGNAGPSALLSFTLDTTNPAALSISLDNDTGNSSVDGITSNGSYTVSGEEGGATIQYSTDDTTWGTTAIVPSEGANTIYVRQIDVAGNVGPSTLLSFTVDTSNPAALSISLNNDTGTSGVDGVTSDGSYTVTGEEGGATIEYSTDDSTWGTAAIVPSEGGNTIYVRQVDVAGNAGPSALLSFTLDTSNPAALSISLDNDTGTSGVDGITNDGSYTVSGEEGGATIQYSTDDASWGTTAIVPSEGANTIYVRQVDVAGNAGPSALLSFTFDTSAPGPLSITLDVDSGTFDTDSVTNNGNYTVSGEEGGATIQYSTNDATWGTTPIVPSEGANTIYVRQVDVAGNPGPSVNLSFTLDTTNPAALSISLDNDTGISSVDGITNDGSYTVSGEEGGATIEYSTDDATWGTTAIVPSEGANTIYVRQVDVAGNAGPSSLLSFTLDTTPPGSLSIALDNDTGSSGVDGITNDGSYSVTGEEGGATIQYSTDDATWGTTAIVPSEGANNIYVRQVDVAGNAGASTLLSFTLDTTPPAAPVVTSINVDTGSSSSDGITNDPTLIINGTAEANSSVEVFVDDVSVATVSADGSGDWTYDYTGTSLSEGDHTIHATATDAAGNTSADSADFNVDVDLTAPTAVVDLLATSDSGSSDLDDITNDTTPTFRVDLNGDVEVGDTVELLIDGGPFTTPLTRLVDDTDVNTNGYVDFTVIDTELGGDGIKAITAQLTDVAGNTSTTTALSITLDTTPPAAPIVTSINVDTGSSNSDGITNDATLIINGTAEANSSVDVFVDDVGVATVSADGSGNWTYDYTGTSLSEGDHTIHATATDAAGNTSADSADFNVDVDLTAPTAVVDLLATSDSGSSDLDDITNDTTPTFRVDLNGDVEVGDTVELLIDGGPFTTPLTRLVDDTDVNTNGYVDFTVIDTELGGDGIKAITAQLTDVAGNTSTTTALNITLDTTAPQGVVDLTAGSDTGDLDSDNLTNDTTPTFRVSLTDAEVGDSVELLLEGSSFDTPLTRVLDANDISNGYAEFTVIDGDLGADGSKDITASLIDVAGNSSTTAALAVTLDTTDPTAPTALDLEATSDSGAFNDDDLTNDDTPTISGLADPAEVGATVRLYNANGDIELGSTTIAGDGSWAITSTQLTPDDTYDLYARITDIAGNTGPASTNLQIEIDTTPPSQPSVGLDSASDSGKSATDDITNITAPTISGTAEANSLITVFDDGVQIDTTLADNGGSWSYTFTSLTHGDHPITATATDLAGNISSISVELLIEVDTIDPIAPLALDLTAATDSGASDTDNITNSTAPVITGTAEPGSTVLIYDTDGVTVLGSGLVDGGGNWSVTSTQLGTLEGPHTITARAEDVAGNIGVPSASIGVTIDQTAPNAPVIGGITTDTGVSSADGITSDNTLSISGTAEANSAVAVTLVGTGVLGTVSADGSGNWTFDYTGTPLADDSYDFTATATDIAGNTSAASTTFVAEVDTAAPVLQSFTSTTTNDTYGPESVINITANYDEAMESGSTISVQLNNGVNVLLDQVSGTSASGSYTVGATNSGEDNGDLSITTINSQSVGDAAGNNQSGTSLPASNLGDVRDIVIDTTPPAVPTGLDLDPASDSGTMNDDDITAVTTPTINGSAPAGTLVTLYDDADTSTPLGTAVANGSGDWSITSSTLADGVITLKATSTDSVGNESALSTGLVITIDTSGGDDTQAPVLQSFSSTTTDDTYGPGSLINITATYDENIQSGSITVVLSNGESVLLDQISSAEVSGTYTVGATGSGQDDADLSISSITSQSVSDAASNTQTGTSLPASNLGDTSDIVIDTTAPPAPSITTITDDTGGSSSDGITTDQTLFISGTAAANSAVELTLVGAGVLDTIAADGSGNWSYDYTGTTLAEGTHSFTATATDAAGNTSAVSSQYDVIVDLTAPAAPTGLDLDPASDSGPFDDDDLTAVTTPTINGMAEANATIILLDGATEVGTTQAAGDGTWSITTSELANGPHNLTATATDAAGNISAASTALVITIDPAAGDVDAPILQSFSSTTSDDTYGPTSLINITATYDENIQSGSLTVVLSNGESVLLDQISGSEVSGTYTVGATGSGEDDNDLSVASITAQSVFDAASNEQTGTTLPASNLGDTSDIVIDTTGPAAPTIDLQAASDLGDSDTDDLTNDDTPTLSGTAEPNSTVEILIGGVLEDSAPVDGAGNWFYTTSSLTEGTYDFTARNIDVAGNVGATSSILSVEIDLTPPTVPSGLDLTEGSDTGLVRDDNITSDSTPTITGAADTGTLVKLYGTTDGGANYSLLGSAEAVAGAWSITSTVLSNATWDLAATATDDAGNESALSAPPLVVLIDDSLTTAQPIILSLTDDTGQSSSDGVTSDDTLTFSGTAVAGSTVEVFLDTVSIGTVLADGGGTWAFSYAATTLAQGSYTLTATATEAGSTSPVSEPFNFEVIPPINWTDGFGDDQWLTTANWIDNQGVSQLPGAGDYARITDVDTSNPVTLTGNTTIGLLDLDGETVNVNGATLAINGIPQFDSSYVQAGGVLNINSGSVLEVLDMLVVDGTLNVTAGTLRYGTFNVNNGLTLSNTTTIDATFDNVVIWGDVSAPSDLTRIDVTGDLEVRNANGDSNSAGTITLGDGSLTERADIFLQGTQNFIAGNVVFNDSSASNNPEFRFDPTNTTGDTFVIGPNASFSGGYGDITITDQAELLLQGSIDANESGRLIRLWMGTGDELTIDTGGTLTASAGNFLQTDSNGVIVNNGSVAATAGSIDFQGHFTNNGAVTGTGTTTITLGSDASGMLNSVGQTISVTGVDSGNLATLNLKGNWDNDGTIDASYAEVNLYGSFVEADIGDFQRGATTGIDGDDGTVALFGAMDLENAAQAGPGPDFSLGVETGPWEVRGGSFSDGILQIQNVAGVSLTVLNQTTVDASFNNVVIWGDVSAPSDLTRIDVTGDLEVRNANGDANSAGTITLGNGSNTMRTDIFLQGTQNFIAGNVVFNDSSVSNSPELRFDPTNTTGDTFVIGPDASISGGYGDITIFDEAELLLQGSIDANESGRLIRLWMGTGDELTIDTGGTLTASAGNFLQTDSNGVIVNNGSVAATAGSIDFQGHFTNNGAVTGTGTTTITLGSDASGMLNSVGQTISVTGVDSGNLATLNLKGNWDNDGTIDASYAEVNLYGSFVEADIGDFQRGATTGIDGDDGTVALFGAMDLENAAQAGPGPDFSLGVETGPWEVRGGSFSDGILQIQNVAGVSLTVLNQTTVDASFNNVVIWGDVSAPSDLTRIDVTGDLEVRNANGDANSAGTITLGNGSNTIRSDLILAGTQNFIAGNVVFNDSSVSNSPELRFDPTNTTGDTFVIGPDASISGGYGDITIFDEAELLLQGSIDANESGRLIRLWMGTGDELTIDTGGTLTASAGNFLQTDSNGVIVNNGSVAATAGSIDFQGHFTNNGAVTGTGTTTITLGSDASGMLNSVGQTISVTGIDSGNLATLNLKGNWDNDGTIDASYAEVNLYGSFVEADIGDFQRGATTGIDGDDGTVALFGAMDLENAAQAGPGPDFSLGVETGPWEVRGGSFSDGILQIQNVAGVSLTVFNAGVTVDTAFNNVVIWGDVSAPQDSTRIDVTGDLEVRNANGDANSAGTITLGNGSNTIRSDLILAGTQNFIAGNVVFNDSSSSNSPELRFDPTNTTGDTFVIGPDASISGGYGDITIFDEAELLLQGSIDANESGRTITLWMGTGDELSIDTGGTVTASAGNFLQTDSNGVIVNNGSVAATAGSLDFQGQFTNNGAVTGTGTTTITLGSDASGMLNSVGQTISVTGIDSGNLATLNLKGNWDNDGTIDASYAEVNLYGSFVEADIGDFQRGATTGIDGDDGTVALFGAMDLENAAQAGPGPDFSLGVETGPWEVRGGSFSDGILQIQNVAGVSLTVFNAGVTVDAAFNNVVIWGDVSAPQDSTRIDVTGDLEVRNANGDANSAGTITLGNGSNTIRSDLILAGTQNFIAGNVVFNDSSSSNSPELRFDPTNTTGDTFVIGPDASISGGYGDITIFDEAELLLQGSIDANVSGRTITLWMGTGDELTMADTGMVTASNGGDLVIQGSGGTVQGSGTIDIDGLGSSLQTVAATDVSLGRSGGSPATLNITDGATASFHSSTVTVLGGVAGEDAVVNITSSTSDTSTWNAGGTLVVARAYNFATDTVDIGSTGGTATVHIGQDIDGDDNVLTVTNLYLGAGGQLTGDGTLNATTIDNDGGTIASGLSPGVLTITGDYMQRSGFLHIELGGTELNDYDRVEIGGNASLSGGTIEFSFYGGFVPETGDSFVFLESAGGIELLRGDIAHAVLGVDAGFEFDLEIGDNTAIFTAHNSAVGGNSTQFYGSSGNDSYATGAGDDFLYGRDGDDTLSGGAGADWFVFSGEDGDDVITDFDVSEDGIYLADGLQIDSITEQDHNLDGVMDTLLTLSSGDTLILEGVSGLSSADELILATLDSSEEEAILPAQLLAELEAGASSIADGMAQDDLLA